VNHIAITGNAEGSRREQMNGAAGQCRLWLITTMALSFSVGASIGCSRSQVNASISTTDGQIAVQNLNAQIDAVDKALDRAPKPMLTTLITLLQTRGQFVGSISDYERASKLAEKLIEEAPDDPASYLALAGTHSTFHQFDESLADLREAERRGATQTSVDRQRASILQAQGDLIQALAIWRQVLAVDRGIVSLGSAASAHGERGEFDEAERLFEEAIREYRDVSPFPVAWVEFQRGLMWQRAGELWRASELFEAAHRRLPAYQAPLDHLAEIRLAKGDRAGAIELLRTLVASSDNPEYAGDLATLLAENGQRGEADSLRRGARKGFEKLLATHPEAFADHAAQFWLKEDPQQALVLARKNLGLRRTSQAYELGLKAALATRSNSLTCQWADDVGGFAYLPSSLRTIRARALAACDRNAFNLSARLPAR
jgi:tetratricopeptide (TPR) repeat protein